MVDITHFPQAGADIPIWRLLSYMLRREYQTAPNCITTFRIVMACLIAAIAVASKDPTLVLIAASLGSMSDGADGFVARWRNQCTEYGKYLDQIADKIFGFALLVPVYAWEGLNLHNAGIGGAVTLYTWAIVWLRKRGYARSSSRTAKWKTGVQYVAGIVYIAGHALHSVDTIQYGYWLMYLSLVLMAWSFFGYLCVAYKERKMLSG